jgi:hypothetical protein
MHPYYITYKIEQLLDTKPPIDLGEYGNSAFYALSILGIINEHLHTFDDYINALDDIYISLNKSKYKKKLHIYHKKELFLIVIKFCLRESFFSSKDTLRILTKAKENKTSYEITGDEFVRQYLSIHPDKLSSDKIKEKRDEVDEVMFMLVASIYAPKGGSEEGSRVNALPRENYKKYVENNFHELLPVFKFYGLDEFGKGSENKLVYMLLLEQQELLINAWREEGIDKNKYFNVNSIELNSIGPQNKKWLAGALIEDHYDNQKGSGPNEDGTYYDNRTPKQRREDERIKQITRGLQTISNLSGGIFAVIGFAIGGDKGSDFGASFDGMAGAALQARMGKQQYEDIGKSLLTNKPNPSAIYQTLTRGERANLRSTKPLMPEPKQIPAQFPRQVDSSQNLVTNPRGISTPNISSPVNNDSRATSKSNRGLSSNSNSTATNTRDQDSVYRVTDYDNLQKKVIIYGVKTNSYFNDFLLGNNPQTFMSQAGKVANASPLGTYSKVLINGEFRSSYGTKASDWELDGRIMEGGHARSNNLGGKEFVVLMSAKYNRKFAGDIEHPSTGGAMAIGEAYIIDKIAIHRSTALDLVNQGHLDASAVQNARVISFELIGFPTRPNLLQFPRKVDMSQNLVQRGIFDPTQPTDK